MFVSGFATHATFNVSAETGVEKRTTRQLTNNAADFGDQFKPILFTARLKRKACHSREVATVQQLTAHILPRNVRFLRSMSRRGTAWTWFSRSRRLYAPQNQITVVRWRCSATSNSYPVSRRSRCECGIGKDQLAKRCKKTQRAEAVLFSIIFSNSEFRS